jgi:hypothetical protein
LHFGPSTDFPSWNEHPDFIRFLAESSLASEGMDKVLLFRIDYEGISDARQETIRDLAEQARAWRIEAVVNAAQHTNFINPSGEISSEYFQMHINSHKENWVEGIKTWDLISYSVQQKICSLNARDCITVTGFFQHGTPRVRLSVLLDMLE